jgi:ABC-type methionine transport system permease subunit
MSSAYLTREVACDHIATLLFRGLCKHVLALLLDIGVPAGVLLFVYKTMYLVENSFFNVIVAKCVCVIPRQLTECSASQIPGSTSWNKIT